MKIYRNERNEIVIDGDGITTMQPPKGVVSISEWLDERFQLEGEKFLVTKFIFPAPPLTAEKK